MTLASPSRSPSYVVGVGASAGGLDALERFFAKVPVDSGMAFVVVQHLSPDFKSLMDELLARRTALPIRLVEDGMPIEADHIYLIPPKKEMIISSGRLLLSERDRQQELTMPIDMFFRSLAQDCGARAVAIVLSGGGSDGSRGIRAVHDGGGLVLVQDEATAQFDGMPKTARDAGVAHWVLAPEDMPAVLLDHARTDGNASLVQGPVAAPQGLAAVYQMLQDEYAIDFKDYKPSTVTRRIERRLALSRAENIDDYIDRLRSEREELDVLYRDLLIGVTRFFRNDEAFAALEQHVLPELLARTPKETPLRVWVAGCATGEEPYSIAILLHELMAEHGERPVKIFATDVHHGSLEIASRGVYNEDAVANVSAERLSRYFMQHGLGYQVVPEIRKMLVFAGHNVVKDPPFTRVDLVSCRNLLIYLQPAAQQKVLSLFHFALNRGGIAFLGPSESAGPLAHDFETIDGHWRIYRKHSDVRIPIDPRVGQGKTGDSRALPHPPAFMRPSPAALIEAYDALLDEFMPPSLLVNDRGELMHSFSGASRFLKRRDGRQSLDVLEMVDAELKMVLVGGLKRASKDQETSVFTGVRITVDGEERAYRVTIRPAHTRGRRASNLLVSFELVENTDRAAASQATPSSKEIDIGNVPHEQIAALEAELNYTRENLQAAIEELEASNEELQASNEELIASNEELQSTNEELQSVNEELYTVNAEYQRKIDELTELTNDMDNLMSSTEVATIFLDSQLQVRKITPQISQVFNLLPTDIGRPIETFTHTIDHPELMDDLRRVLENGERIEREIRDRQGRSFFLRVLPYRARGRADGVVLTLIDVSGLKAAEDALFHERYLLESLMRSARDAIYFRDTRGRYIRANLAMAQRLGIDDVQQLVGKTPFEICDRAKAMTLHENDEPVLRDGQEQHYHVERRTNGDGLPHWDLSTRMPLRDPDGKVVGVIGVLRDISEQKVAEQEIKQAVQRRDQFLAMLSHELRNPLGAIVMAIAVLRQNGSAEQREAILQTLARQSTQMARLLDDLLEASRVTQDKIELRRQIVDLGAVAREAADAVRGALEARGVQFAVEIDSDPLWVDGDPARLQQIQVNMLSNAAKYTPAGGHVLLEVRRDGSDASIRVRDDGVGIPVNMLDKIFDLFVQSNQTLDRSEGGLGLGLTLVRSLVLMHGGSVCASSDGEGKGAEFSVRLPTTTGPHIEAAATPAKRDPLQRGAKVVLVEDNEDTRDILCQYLALAGFEARGAFDGPSGIALIREVRADVAIIDVGLPGIDGFEVARQIRSDPAIAKTRLIALTGYGQASDREKAIASGFDEHLVKPVAPDKLAKLLATGNGSGSQRHK